MPGADLVVASNRGPVSFSLDERGEPVPAGSAGGLAASLAPLLAGTGATWVACAMSEADRAAAERGLVADGGIRLQMVRPSPETYQMAYDVVSNTTLWFMHHHLFDLTRRPRLDRRWDEAWQAYGELNDQFAQVVSEAAAEGATVLVQDYHLTLLPGLLRARRPDLRTVHFSHTPFADPGILRVLPEQAARQMLSGMAAARGCGFHTARWERAYRACCADHQVDAGRSFVSPLTPDVEELRRRASEPACTEARRRLEEMLGDRQLVLRVDRIEPAKNLLRGFWALDELFTVRPDLRRRVVMVAHAYHSRQSLAEYLAYANEVEHAAQAVNERWGDDGWQPVVLELADDTASSLAGLTRYDVLLVNPLRDGLNLVAKEGPLLNTTDGVLALSREAGAFEELHEAAVELNPFDVSATAAALAQALDLGPEERARRAERLRRIVQRRTPADWLADVLAQAGPPEEP